MLGPRIFFLGPFLFVIKIVYIDIMKKSIESKKKYPGKGSPIIKAAIQEILRERKKLSADKIKNPPFSQHLFNKDEFNLMLPAIMHRFSDKPIMVHIPVGQKEKVTISIGLT